jgi:lipoprotein-anchoring transpeptidase ErfK/SrfK
MQNNGCARGGVHRFFSFLHKKNYALKIAGHGVYLFHTVPTDKAGNYISAAAALLGTASDSHGCVRLSIPDARWINENARVGMRVHVY